MTPEIKHRSRIESAARKALTGGEFGRVRFFSPEELFAFVQELEINDAKKEQTVCGYKVKRSLRPVDAGDRSLRQQALAEVVAKSMSRLRKKK